MMPAHGFCRYCDCELPEPPSTGRPPAYCSGRCRQAAYRARRTTEVPTAPTASHADIRVREFAEDLLQESRHLLRLLSANDGSSLEPVQHAAQLAHTVDKLTAALVVRARSGNTPWELLGSALDMRPETARKTFRVARSGTPRSAAPRTTDPVRSPSPSGGWSTAPAVPQSRLAPVLARLARISRLSQRELASRMDVSPTQLSRILSGQRFPRWELVERLARICGADPVVLRQVWQEDQSRREGETRPSSEGTLHFALRELHLNAGAPDLRRLVQQCPHARDAGELAAVLCGTRDPSHGLLADLVTALDGDLEHFRTLWQDLDVPHERPPAVPWQHARVSAATATDAADRRREPTTTSERVNRVMQSFSHVLGTSPFSVGVPPADVRASQRMRQSRLGPVRRLLPP